MAVQFRSSMVSFMRWIQKNKEMILCRERINGMFAGLKNQRFGSIPDSGTKERENEYERIQISNIQSF